MRAVFALLVLVVAAVVWMRIVATVGIWWTLRHPPALPPGTDTYFITSNRIFWLAVGLPLVLLAIWIWRHVVSRTA